MGVIQFPTPARELSEPERAQQLVTWQHALEASRPDLCIVCSAPTSAHFDEAVRARGCLFALQQVTA